MEMGTKAALQLEEYEVRIAELLKQIETLKDKKDKAPEGSKKEAELRKEIEILKGKLAKSKLTEPQVPQKEATPAVPARRRLGISPCERNPWKILRVASGRIHSSIFFGRYFSTQRNSLSDIVVRVNNNSIRVV